MKCFLTLVAVITVLQVPSCIRGSKILLAPFVYASHIHELVQIGDELIQNGHSVHIMLSESYPDIGKFRRNTAKMPLLEFHMKYPDFYVMEGDENPMTADMINMPPITDFRTNIKGFEELCFNPLEDSQFYANLQQENYDLVLVDAFPGSRCYYILFYKLGVPYVSMTTQFEPWLYRLPALPSFVPFGFSMPPKSQEMSFYERLVNTYDLVRWTAFHGVTYLDDSLVAKYAPEMPFVTLDWLAGRSLLWLIDTDVSLDYPRPMMPNEVNIGGMGTGPGKPLTGAVSDFVDSATDGVIIASFGSIDLLTDEMLQHFLDAYSMLQQKVLMRFTRDVPSNIRLPSNVRLLKWLPQNDLLAHTKTKLFISHGGANSQFEAMYHAVPTIIFPLFGDQPYNAKRGEYKGISITMDILSFSAEELVENIREILTANSSYRRKVQEASAVFRSAAQNPRQRAAFWINHVIQHGGEHLRSHALDIPWYQYMMLDMLACVFCALTIMLVLLYILLMLVSKLVRPVAKSTVQKQKKKRQ